MTIILQLDMLLFQTSSDDDLQLDKLLSTSNLSSVYQSTTAQPHQITAAKYNPDNVSNGVSGYSNYSDTEGQLCNTLGIPVKLSVEVLRVVYALVLAMLDGFCMGSAILLLTETDLKLKRDVLIPMLWQYAVGTLIVGFLMPVQNHTRLLGGTWGMNLTDFILVCIHVVSLVGSNALTILCSYYCDAFLMGICSTSNIVFMAIISWTLLWGVVPAHRNALAIIGIILILIASVLRVIGKRNEANQRTDTNQEE